MNRSIVLDASVIVKWSVSERDSEIATALIEQENPFFYIPGHALGEVFETLIRKRRQNEIVDEQLDIAILNLPGSFISVEISELISESVRLALDLSISFYDALYVALADSRGASLVTDDQKLVRALSKSAFSARIVLLADAASRGLVSTSGR